jgi:hypothetical protein
MKVVLPAVLAATICAGGLSVAAAASGDQAPSPNAGRGPEHARFDDPQPNRWFPLQPGTVSRYRGSEEGRRFTERVVVTSRTKVVDGVTTTVVRDVVRRADGSVAERTRDWYATDDAGNVWYFGEDTATYDRRGRVESREGSWQAGVDGAVAGTIMPADPAPTDAYRQEYARGSAEDQAWIVQRGVTSTVPYGTVHDVVRTLEWSRLEKDVVSAKLYAPGLGIVREEDLSGGDETFELLSVHRR